MPAAMSTKTALTASSRGNREPISAKSDAAGDLREADEPDGEGGERCAVAAFEQERDRVHGHRDAGERAEEERGREQPERNAAQRVACGHGDVERHAWPWCARAAARGRSTSA